MPDDVPAPGIPAGPDVPDPDPDTEVAKVKPGIAGTPVYVNHRGKLSWEDLPLDQNLRKGLAKKGFVGPSDIQEKILPAVLTEKKNVIGQAKNGSGKTAAFCLSILAVCDETNLAPQALLLTHSHELARQNLSVLRDLGSFKTFKYKLLVPGGDLISQDDTAHIIVGTPGKISDMIKRRKLRTNELKMFILDEADTLVGPLLEQTKDIQRRCPSNCQILCFSATFSPKTLAFVRAICPDAHEQIIESSDLSLECIGQYYIPCATKDEKKKAVNKLYSSLSISQSVIFVDTKEDAMDLKRNLTANGHTVAVLTGGRGPNAMPPEQRSQVMNEFKNGTSKVLIATDVIARGVDVPQVTVVINYELPSGMDEDMYDAKEVYLHRIGRTGRFGLAGISINLATQNEITLQLEIEKQFGCKINPLPMDPEEIERIVRELRD